ncbi:MAG: hypothetical protein WC247_02605 [Porticoccaceae bacterium]|jgi:uncharacterized protein (TIGR02001 family)
MHSPFILTAIALGITALSTLSTPAHGDTFFDLSGLISLASDGISKDTSETDENPQAVLYLEAAHGAFFTGAKLKNIKGADGSDFQHEYSVGIKGDKAGFQLALQVAYKIKEGGSLPDDSHVEWKGDISRTFERTTAKLEVEYSPDSSGPTKKATWINGSLAQKLNDKWSVSGGIGTRKLSPAKDYNGIDLGVTYGLFENTSLDLRYYDTDRHEYGKGNEERLVLKLTQKF